MLRKQPQTEMRNYWSII